MPQVRDYYKWYRENYGEPSAEAREGRLRAPCAEPNEAPLPWPLAVAPEVTITLVVEWMEYSFLCDDENMFRRSFREVGQSGNEFEWPAYGVSLWIVLLTRRVIAGQCTTTESCSAEALAVEVLGVRQTPGCH